MKGILVIFLVGLTAVCALPAKKDEVEIVEGSYGDQPIVDTGILVPAFPSFDYFQGLMTRLRQQMETLLHTFPFSRGNSSDVDFPGGLSVGFPQFPPIDLGKGNTTSVTKVIDGHKVVINETEYKKEDDFGGSYFKVKIIDVLPNDNETTLPDVPEVESVTPKKDREPLENSVENEIPKGEDFSNLESFDETDNIEEADEDFTQNLDDAKIVDLSGDVMVNDMVDNNIINPDAETVPSNLQNKFENLEQFDNDLPQDLSRDTYINEIAAQRGDPINPESESISTNDEGELETLYEDFRGKGWKDLSRDTYINELAANDPSFLNPDAEYITPHHTNIYTHQYPDNIIAFNGETIKSPLYQYNPSRYRK